MILINQRHGFEALKGFIYYLHIVTPVDCLLCVVTLDSSMYGQNVLDYYSLCLTLMPKIILNHSFSLMTKMNRCRRMYEAHVNDSYLCTFIIISC